MKLKLRSFVGVAACLATGFSSSFAQDHDHHEGEGHELVTPNGGRLVALMDSHAEIFVKDDGGVQVTFLDEEGAVVAPSGQLVTLVGGNRMDPIQLDFAESGDSLLSEGALPLDKPIPVVVQFQAGAGEKTYRERFQLNMSSCPTCEYKEYACVCHEDEESEHGHEHGGSEAHSH